MEGKKNCCHILWRGRANHDPSHHAATLLGDLMQVLWHVRWWHGWFREDHVDACNFFLSILDWVSHQVLLLQMMPKGVVHVGRELSMHILHEFLAILEAYLHRLHHFAQYLLSSQVALQQLSYILHLCPERHHLIEEPLRLLGVLLRQLRHHLLAQLPGHIAERGAGLLLRRLPRHGNALWTTHRTRLDAD